MNHPTKVDRYFDPLEVRYRYRVVRRYCDIGTSWPSCGVVNGLLCISAPPKKLVTCVTFDEGYDGVQGLLGLWVHNSGVSIVNDSSLCKYKNCGSFSGSARLEIPFFGNNMQWYRSFSVSMFFLRNAGANDQGLVSNDCFNNMDYAAGNSLYVSSQSGAVSSNLVDPAGNDAGVVGQAVSP